MQVWTRVGAILAVSLAFSQAARGDEPIHMYPVSDPSAHELSPYPYRSFSHHNNPYVGTGFSPNPPVRSTRVGDRLRKCDACCWAHHNNLECSNLKAELTFIFGSCKAFYGERCLPRPLPVDHHGWWDRFGRY